MDTKIILPIITTLIGIILGFILNELSYIYRIHREDKRKLKKVLFNLLDFYYLLNHLNVDDYIEILLKKIKEKFLKYNPEQNLEDAKPIFKSFLLDSIKSVDLPKFKELQVSYVESINEIAQVDPVLAYSLSGRTDLYNFISIHIDEYFNNAEIFINSKDSNYDRLVTYFKPKQKKDLFKDAIKTVSNDINNVSKKIGLSIKKDSQRILKKLDKKISDEILKKIDDYLDEFGKQFLK